MNIDQSCDKLNSLIEQVEIKKDLFLNLTEEDTRIKIIEVILKNILYWPENGISREERTEDFEAVKFTDYRLRINNRYHVVVEAKKTSIDFNFPAKHRRIIKIKTLISEVSNISKAIKQCKEYCDDCAIKYSIVTNGFAWVIFKSIREDIPWKDGNAIVYSSLKDIKDHFTDFYNLLAFNNINKNQLDLIFSSKARSRRQIFRVLDKLHSADRPLIRNRLHSQLDVIIETYFKDIADNEYIELLKECYVYSKDDAFSCFSNKIKDEIPNFLRGTNTVDVNTSKYSSGEMSSFMHDTIEKYLGKLLLVLGGIGSGKTTFLKRFFRLTDADFLNKKAVWFYISFLGPPASHLEIDRFIYTKILSNIRSSYSDIIVEDRKTIKKAYAEDIQRLHKSIFEPEKLSADEIEKKLTPYIVEWQSDICQYSKKLLGLFNKRGRAIIICLDNVDQLSPLFQEHVYLAAQNIYRETNSIVILALREETYYSARTQKTFTAYSNQKYHIISPDFIKLIGKRISVAKSDINKKDGLLSRHSSLQPDTITDIYDFISIIENSLFTKNKSLVRFINSMCFGNMRLALEYFSKFLLSGATYVDKMLRIYRDEGSYTIPFHEFIKSIMVDDRVYYCDSKSSILNVFFCGIEENSSHFTSIRILQYLKTRESIYSAEGSGFISIDTILDTFEEVFQNRTDAIVSCNRLLGRSLIETNTKATDDISNSSHIRITNAGIYYILYLVKRFVYLDLVLMDTPLNDEGTRDSIFKISIAIEDIPDYQKQEKTLERFKRTEMFIKYLKNEERDEKELFSLISEYDDFKCEISKELEDDYLKDKKWILDNFKKHGYRFDAEELSE